MISSKIGQGCNFQFQSCILVVEEQRYFTLIV